MLRVVLAVMLVLGLPFPGSAVEALAAEGNSNAREAAPTDGEESPSQAVDLAALWRDGDAKITEPGTYYVSESFETDKLLVVAVDEAEEGAEVVIDFRGNTVTVRGEVACGINADATCCPLTLTDSTTSAGDEGLGDADANGGACLRVISVGAKESVAGVCWNAPIATATTNASVLLQRISVQVAVASVSEALPDGTNLGCYGVYAACSDAPDDADALAKCRITLEDCAVEAVVVGASAVGEGDGDYPRWADDETASQGAAQRVQTACAVHTASQSVTLAGHLGCHAVSDGVECELSSARAGAFFLEDGFAPTGSLRVVVGQNLPGALFASCCSVDEAQRLQGFFAGVDATGSNSVLVQGTDLLMGEPCAQGGSAQEAEAGASDAPADDVVPLDAGEVCLNDVWGDRSQPFTISESGTYYLGDDMRLSGSARLDVNAEGIEVVIDLGGHAIDANLYTFSELIRVNKATSVRIENGSIFCASAKAYSAIRLESEECALSLENVKVTARPTSEFMQMTSQQCYALTVNAGEVTARNSTFVSDQSGYAQGTSSNEAMHAIAVYVSSDARVRGATFQGCEIAAATSPMATDKERNSFVGPGYRAYGIHALCSSEVRVSDCRIEVGSANGSAYGVLGRNVVLTGENVVVSNAGYNAVALQSVATRGILLDGRLGVSYEGGAVPRYGIALYSESADGFVLGPEFSGEGITAFLGADEATANASGTLIASYSYTPSSSQLGNLGGMIVNAMGDSAACDVAAAADGVRFVLDEACAPVEVARSDGSTVRYSTVAQAFEAARSDDTVRLLKDAGDITFSRTGDSSLSLTLDMNGHTATSLTTTSDASLEVVSSGEGAAGGFAGVTDAGGTSAVAAAGSGSLVLRGIVVENISNKGACKGVEVSGSGSVTLDAVSVRVSSTKAKSVGVEVLSKASGAVSLVNGGVLAYTEAAENSSAAYGVWSDSSQAEVRLLDCPVTVRGVSMSTGGITTNGPLVVAGSRADTQVIDVRTSDVASEVWGVRGISDKADVTLDTCTVRVHGPSGKQVKDAEYWALMSGTSSAPAAVRWLLDGACSFENDGEVLMLQGGSPLKVGAAFSLLSSAKMSIEGAGLDGGVFAEAADADMTLRSFAGLFVAAASGQYASWEVTAGDADYTSLKWATDDVAINTRTAARYTTFDQALSEAKGGDTVKLLDNASTTASVKVADSLTIDLAGRTLVVDVSESGAECAVELVGAGTLVVEDSSHGKGVLSLRVGSLSEKGYYGEASTKYKGIASTNGGAVSVRDALVRVRYAGESAQPVAVTVYGVYLASGALTLEGSAQLEVLASEDGKAVGASSVYGVYCEQGGAFSEVTVGADASIRAENHIASFENNAIRTRGLGNSKMSDLSFERIYPRTDSDLYQEILSKFIQQAEFDDTADKDGSSKFAGRIYHAEEIELDNGTFAWAYSDYVPAGQETADKVVPLVIFVQSTYTVEPQAICVGFSQSAQASGSVRGSLHASSAGEAWGARLLGSGSWELKEASIDASGGTSLFRLRGEEKIDLRDYIPDAQVSTDKTWIYPSSMAAYEVRTTAPRVRGIEAGQNTAVTLDGATSITSQGGDPVDVMAPKLEVGGAFSVRDGEPVSLGSGSGRNIAGTTAVKAEDGAQVSRETFVDAYGRLSADVDEGGNVVWDASYVVSFNKGTNAVAVFDGLKLGDVVDVPEAALFECTTEVTQNYQLVGWSTDPDAEEPQITLGEKTLRVEGSATYYPVYRVTPREVTVEFTDMRDSAGSLMPAQTAIVEVMKTLDESNAQVPAPSDYRGEDGSSYRFVGWSVDNVGLYDGDDVSHALRFDLDVVTGSMTKVELRAVYVRVGEGERLVRFLTDGQVVAGAFKVGTRPRYSDAATGGVATPMKLDREDGFFYTFAGFYEGRRDASQADGGAPDFSATDALPEVTDDAVYTSSFKAMRYTTYVRAKYWVRGDGSYANTLTENIAVPYGDDPIGALSQLVSVGDTFTQGGITYTFAGWSTRETDKEPSYVESLPLSVNTSFSSTTAIYYGIYTSSEQLVDVVFHVGDQEYGRAEGMTAASSVKGALDAAGLEDPEGTSAGRFKGWATTADATRVNAYPTSSLRGLAGDGATLHLYAVFGNADGNTATTFDGYGAPTGGEGDLTVAFYDSDRETLLSTAKAGEGKTVEGSGATLRNPAQAGSFFKGWVDEAGESFDVHSTAVSEDISLHATYGTVSASVSDTINASGSTEGVTFAGEEGVGKGVMTFELGGQPAAAEDLVKEVEKSGDVLISDAVYEGYFKADSTKVDAAKNFGTMRLSLYKGTVASDAKVRVYWLNADGGVSHSAAVTPDDHGMVSVEVDSYRVADQAAEGNIVIAQANTAPVGGPGGVGVGIGALPAGGAAAAPGVIEPGITPGVGSIGADAAAEALFDELSEEDEAASLPPEDDAAVDEAFRAVAGNPLIWVLTVLILGVIGASAWWFLVGRRHGVVDDDDGEWSKDADSDDGSASRGASGGDSGSGTGTPAPAAVGGIQL